MSHFDRETEVVRTENNHFSGYLSPAWNIGSNPNGGYMVSVALKALQQVVPHSDPVSVTTHYLRPGTADSPCTIVVHVVRSGRTLSTARATLVQEGKERVEVLAAFSDLHNPVGIDTTITSAPANIAAPDDCIVRDGSIQNLELPISSRLDVRLEPDLAVPGQAGRAEMAGWIRYTDGREPDTSSLVLFTDAFPPSPLAYLNDVSWVPTLELTVNVIRSPAPGWILAQFKTDSLKDGRMIESGSLWDSNNHLVAMSRQLGIVVAAD